MRVVSERAGADPRVTAVMLTWNRWPEVLRSLERLVALPERPRVILVDNGSTDGTVEGVAASLPQVDVVRLPENRGAAARNAGAQSATTPYVAFSDDDTWWTPGALHCAADLLDAHPRLAIVTGRILVGPEERLDPTCALMADSPLPPEPGLPGRPVIGFMAGATVARRSAFLAAGGFEPRLFIGGEEQLLSVDLLTAGWALAYVPEVAAHHHPSRVRQHERRRVLLLRNALWFAWLRRPARAAIDATARALCDARTDAAHRRALIEALRGLPWALRRRRVVPRKVEDGLRCLVAARRAPAPAASAVAT